MLRTSLVLLAALGSIVGPAVAQSISLEDAARERVRLEASRYAILRAHLDAPALPEAAKAEIAALNESMRAIEQRYRDANPTAPGGGGGALHNRTRELLGTEVAPSWNRLMLERFPLPDRVRRDFNTDARYAAALITVGFEFTLGRTIRPPRTPELDARDALYSKAIEAAMAPYKEKGEQSREWRTFEREMLASSQSAAFKREVLGRYVPLFASFVKDDPAPSSSSAQASLSETEKWLWVPAWGDEFGDYMIVRGQVLAVAGVALVIAGCIVLPPWLSRRRGRRHNASRGRQPLVSPMALPPDLQVPELPAGLRPELFVENARVLDLQTWSETSVTWQSSSGNQYVAPRVSVQSRTVQKDRLWVQTADGIERAWMITGGVFAANRGHFITWLQARLKSGDAVPALAFNHNTQQWHEQDWLDVYHRGFWKHWLLLNLLWIVPCCVALNWLIVVMRGPEFMGLQLLGGLALFSFVWVGITHWWTEVQRKRAWQRNHRPRVLDWMRSLARPDGSAKPEPAAR